MNMLDQEERIIEGIEPYGPLKGVRVLETGQSLAGPGATKWLGDFGAEIIKVERPAIGDLMRAGFRKNGVVPKWISLARNKLSIEFEMDFIKYPEAKDLFIDLVKNVDIWLNAVPGIAKKGATDELALEANPKLVIVHLTGYGIERFGGAKGYSGRAMMDLLTQAFTGFMFFQGSEGDTPVGAKPNLSDLISGQAAVFGALCGYINAQKTGKGQVIDASMYEAMGHAFDFQYAMALCGQRFARTGCRDPLYLLFGIFQCKGGSNIVICVVGENNYKKVLELLGTTIEEFPYDGGCIKTNPDISMKMEAKWNAWLAEHTADEVEQILLEKNIPVGKAQDILDTE
jgi:crotonobetainyl-CoA:carnitine CoA-transferase CaiB-like acyl-CoA transferase